MLKQAEGERAVRLRVPERFARPELLAAGIAAVYAVLLAANLRGILAATYLDADTAAAPVVGQLFTGAGHSQTILGTFPWYATLIWELATRWLPLHREIWELGPVAMAMGSSALCTWMVLRVAGRRAAALTLVVTACLSPRALHLVVSMTEHGPDWFCVIVLAAIATYSAGRGGPASPRGLILVALGGLVVGVNGASDPLVLIAGVVPFALALGDQVWRTGPAGARPVWHIALATLVPAAVAYLATRVAMSSLGVVYQHTPNNNTFTTDAAISTNFRLLWECALSLGNGYFFGQPFSLHSVLALLAAVSCLAALLAAPRLGLTRLRGDRPSAGAEPPAAERVLLTFWLLSAVLLGVSFLVSAAPIDLNADRYIVGLLYAAAVLLPVLCARRPGLLWLAAAGACVVGFAGTVSMIRGVNTQAIGAPTDAEANGVARIAARLHLNRGYAGYWDAEALTWAAHLQPLIYPVQTCGSGICRMPLHAISDWYQPSGGRTFLLVDSSQPLVNQPIPSLGRAIGTYSVGPITMFVYGYDIASKIQP